MQALHDLTWLCHDLQQRSSCEEVVGGVELGAASRQNTRTEPVEQARDVGGEVGHTDCRGCECREVDGLDLVEERGLPRLESTEGTPRNEAPQRVADDAEPGHALRLCIADKGVNLLQDADAARVDAVVGEVALVGLCAENAQLVRGGGVSLLVGGLDGLDDALDVCDAAPEPAAA